MRDTFKFMLIGLLAISFSKINAQDFPSNFLPNAHSHNDYSRPNAFHQAYSLGFGSIEVDLFFKDNELYVGHDWKDIQLDRTFESMYLKPILKAFSASKDGYIYPNQGQLLLLIDPKTDGVPVLRKLEELLKPYRNLFDSKNNPKAVKLVITGNRPKSKDFHFYDEIFYFDGNLKEVYQPNELPRIGLISAPLKDVTSWNGLGRLTDQDLLKLTAKIDSVHRLGKKIRFWAAPDTKTTWIEWLKLGIDYINTDKTFELAEFLRSLPKTSYTEQETHELYRVQHKIPLGKKPKNVILLISDGAGLSQLWAAKYANKGGLNVLNMPYAGYLFTQSADNYHTDSAAGGSAIATGHKTKNRSIGVDSLGNKVDNIVEVLVENGYQTGIISNDEIIGATPSAFYTHVQERDDIDAITKDLIDAKQHLIIAAPHPVFFKNDSLIMNEMRNNRYYFEKDLNQLASLKKEKVCLFLEDEVNHKWNKLDANQSSLTTSTRMIENSFLPAISFLQNNNPKAKGFFLMMEGAKIDGGGHSNAVDFTIQEYLSFDRLVGQALKFADENKETLVIVTSDHETGGLTVLDAQKETGKVIGNFATTDHTGIPVPLAAYGPGAEYFQGFIDNTQISKIIYDLLKVKK